MPSVWSAFAALSGRFASVRAVGDAVLSRRLCAFARAHCRCESFRREYVGAKCGSRTAASLDSFQGLAEWQSALLRGRIVTASLSAGSTLGLNVEAAQPPLWTLFRGWLSGRVRFTRRFVSVHACCLSRDKQDGLRDVAFLFRRVEIAIRAFSGCWHGYLPLWVHFGLAVCLRRSRRDCRGRGGCGERGYGGLAARPLCSFAQPHWLCNAFRGEYAGAARPRLRQRVFDSLDSLQGLAERQSALYAAGLCWCGFAAPSPGYTERPVRL